MCVHGVAVVEDVLARVRAQELRVYVLWQPVLPSDDRAAAGRAAAELRRATHGDPRIVQYWDEHAELGWALGELLELPSDAGGRRHGLGWDVYLVYRPGARWGTRPGFWMSQLGLPEAVSPSLGGPALTAELSALVAR
jgi:hypothetical protein